MKHLILLICCLAAMLCCACALAEVQVSAVTATSWIVGKNPEAYAPARMIDGEETTSFQFSTNTTALGEEYVFFTLAAPSEVSTLWIKNGFWRITDGLDQYTRNSRVKSMTISFLYIGASTYTDSLSLTLPDDQLRADWTTVSLGVHTNVVGVRFRIDAIYVGTRFPTDVCISEVRFGASGEGTPTTALYGLATQKLATRSGPGTTYTEQGTYEVAGQYIRVLSRAWDSRNEIWWVKCEIPYRNEIRVLWTGYKRFDSATLPLESIPVESAGAPIVSTTALSDWRTLYRTFVTGRQYMAYQHHPGMDEGMEEMLQSRDTSWDRCALYDLNHDGTPELLVLADYGIEQADVFTCVNGGIVWVGVIGGDNFFQRLIYFDDPAHRELYTLMGGPAMRISAHWMVENILLNQAVAVTLTNSQGDDTIGLGMYVSNSDLYQLLYHSIVEETAPANDLPTFRVATLMTDTAWNTFCAMAIY